MNSITSLEAYFKDLPDLSISAKCDHRLLDIVMIASCVVIVGAESWDEIAFWRGESRMAETRVKLPHGIPSHDTVVRVFRKLDSQAFQERFLGWVQAVFVVTQGQGIAIDGKTVRGTRDSCGKAHVHLVSAWASVNGISLGQMKVKTKSNEITAIPELLQLLVLKVCIVTLDALGCQTAIAEAIIQQQADYVLAVKEQHQCWVLADQHVQAQGWVGCQTLVRVMHQRQQRG